MTTRNYYSSHVHGPFETFSIGDFALESGGTLRDLKLAYRTLGELSPGKDNVVLFPSWYSGSSKILEQAYIGPGRVLHPERYFIILVNQIGNGLSSSPHNTPAPFDAARFPRVTIGDDVRAQHRLITEKFGIRELALVIGGSMGAQQTYDWAIRFPDIVKRAAPIAGTARVTPHNRLLVETFIEAITSDPAWDGGWYDTAQSVQRGLRRHARVFGASAFTPQVFNQELWRQLGFSSQEDFIIGFLEGHFVPQDPNNLLALLAKWKGADATRITRETLKHALAGIAASVAVIAIDEDAFFPLTDIEREQRLIPNSTLKRISSPWGHLALFGIDPNYNRAIDDILLELLSGEISGMRELARPVLAAAKN
ncbi:MAG TPA: alpha/beta fold hydrolase [Hyphomicrobium sp.]|nr:alpha/beta fold hydrolase [Hyphomicrobium sp.]